MVTDTTVNELRNKRLRADISQAEIAAELGISERSVWGFENKGSTLPRARTILDYVEAIDAIKARRAEAKAS